MMITSSANDIVDIKNENNGNSQEFRRNSRAMSFDAKDSTADQLPNTHSKESALRDSNGSTEIVQDEDVKNSKEFRRGGRAMSQEVSIEPNEIDQTSLDEGGPMKTKASKKKSKSLNRITNTEGDESFGNSASDENDQPRSETKPRIEESKSEISQIEEKQTETEISNEIPESPNHNDSTIPGKKGTVPLEGKSDLGDNEGQESDQGGTINVGDASNVQPRKAKAEQGVKGLRGGEGATKVQKKAKKKSVKSE
jgi:hypothetical protein